MLEHYMFPWGNKRKLQHEVELLKMKLGTSQLATKITENALRDLERMMYQLQDELHEVHLRKLLPIVDHVASTASVKVYTENLYEFDEQVLGVNYRTRRFKATNDSAMDYTKRAIHHCAHALAEKITEHIAYRLKNEYRKLKERY